MKSLHPLARNLAGLSVGRLSIIEPCGRRKDGHVAWRCLCECGQEKLISSNSLTRANPVQSCGCLNGIRQRERMADYVPWNEGKSYAINAGEHCYKTRHAWAKAVLRHYGNRCEECGWGKARCDAHHRVLKSQGGLHTIANGIVLCPNCHRIRHEGRSA